VRASPPPRVPGRPTGWGVDYQPSSELSRLIELLPVPCLLLAQDGTAIAANEKWAGLSGVPVHDALSDGWLRAIGGPDRNALRALVQDAAVDGIDGSADVWIATPGAEQWSRWSWGAIPVGRLLVTVVSLAVSSPRALPLARGWRRFSASPDERAWEAETRSAST
jgi:PAS domain-containing protein